MRSGVHFPPREAAILLDHARALNFLITDGVVPSNSKEGYFVRLLIRRSLRLLSKAPEAPEITSVLDRVARDLAHYHPEIGQHRDDLHRVVENEVERYGEAIARARGAIRRQEERARSAGGRISADDLLEWYDSLGVPPEVAVEELKDPPAIPEDFYARVAARHESEVPSTDYTETTEGLPEPPARDGPDGGALLPRPVHRQLRGPRGLRPRSVRRARPDLLLSDRGRSGIGPGPPRRLRSHRRRPERPVGAAPDRPDRALVGRGRDRARSTGPAVCS